MSLPSFTNEPWEPETWNRIDGSPLVFARVEVGPHARCMRQLEGEAILGDPVRVVAVENRMDRRHRAQRQNRLVDEVAAEIEQHAAAGDSVDIPPVRRGVGDPPIETGDEGVKPCRAHRRRSVAGP